MSPPVKLCRLTEYAPNWAMTPPWWRTPHYYKKADAPPPNLLASIATVATARACPSSSYQLLHAGHRI